MNIVRIQIVLGVTNDPLLHLKLGSKLASLSESLKGKLSTINAPEVAPPEIPRTILQFEKSALNVSLNRIELITGIPEHVKDNLDSAFDYAISKAKLIYNALKEDLNYTWLGTITELEFPKDSQKYNNQLSAITPVVDKLLNIHRDGKELGTFDLTFGFYEEEHYVGYKINGYEIKEIPIQESPNLDINKLPVKSLGIEVRVDINNKRVINRGDILEDLQSLLDIQKKVISERESRLNLEGVI